MSSKALTVAEKLVVAAADLQQRGTSPFSAEDLVVRAWRLFPDTFGLAGYADEHGDLMYPDSNRVFSEIMGTKPVRKRGLLEKVGRKQYRLTHSGISLAELLSSRQGQAPEKTGLGRAARLDLQRLMGTRAFQKFTNGQRDRITFYDACAFWGISPRSSAMNLAARREHVAGLLRSGVTSLHGAQEQALSHGGQTLSEDDLKALSQLDSYLVDQFEKELSVIRARTDER